MKRCDTQRNTPKRNSNSLTSRNVCIRGDNKSIGKKKKTLKETQNKHKDHL